VAYQRTPYIESKRSEARQRIVQAALALLARGGWREVQVSAVAAAAGLSTGAVYLHFESKTRLLAEVYRVQAGAELALVARIADDTGPAAERLAAAINAFAQRAMRQRRLAYAMVLEPSEIDVVQERLDFHAAFIAQFRRILDAGVTTGEFSVADTEVAAACIFGGMTESLMGPLTAAGRAAGKARPRSARDAAALVEHLLAFCFHGLGRPVPARRRPALKANASGG